MARREVAWHAAPAVVRHIACARVTHLQRTPGPFPPVLGEAFLAALLNRISATRVSLNPAAVVVVVACHRGRHGRGGALSVFGARRWHS